jgi:hypothetical protein
MDEKQKSSQTQSQWSLITLILAVAAGSVTYRLVLFKKLEQTSMLFIWRIIISRQIASGKLTSKMWGTVGSC